MKRVFKYIYNNFNDDFFVMQKQSDRKTSESKESHEKDERCMILTLIALFAISLNISSSSNRKETKYSSLNLL